MVASRSLIIRESERKRISGLYEIKNKNEYVITDWLSPNEDYVIFLDELYDIKNKKCLGDVWENFDNFKFFLEHSFKTAKNIPSEIKNYCINEIRSLTLTESTQDMRELKPLVKELINETAMSKIFNPFSKDFYKGETWKDAWEGLKQTGGDVVAGTKELVSNISKGEIKKAFAIIGKGFLYLMRRIREFLYTPVGLVLDAIFVATGIGKAAPFVIWALVVCLDIYELINNDYEDDMKDLSIGWKLLFLGCDILGMVTAGVAAKGVRGTIKAAISAAGRTSDDLVKYIAKSPKLRSVVEFISKNLESGRNLLNQGINYLKNTKFGSFITPIISSIEKFFGMLATLVGELLGGAGAVLNTPGKLAQKGAKALNPKIGAKGLEAVGQSSNVVAAVGGAQTYGNISGHRKAMKLADEISSPNWNANYSGIAGEI